MSGFFSKLFGGEKKTTGEVTRESLSAGATGGSDAAVMVEQTIAGVVENGDFDLSFTVLSKVNGEIEDVFVEFSGPDEEILTAENGELLDSLQLFAKRVLQHKLSDVRAEVHTDANGFREKATQSLVEVTEKLKEKCLESGKSQYMRPLAPKDRKTVHQHLATDERVRSRSIGEGHFKKVKIYPAKNANDEVEPRESRGPRDGGNSRGPRGNSRDGGNSRDTGNKRTQSEEFDSPDENFGNR